jgi:predicted TIM-barrel fold metal-dependent hydrolase
VSAQKQRAGGGRGRREFIAATGIAALSTLAAGSTEKAGGGGRIDCQSHLYPPDMLDWMERRKESPYVYRKDGARYVVIGDWQRKVLPNHSDVRAKLGAMDESGIELTALSINDPGPELFGKDGPAVARMVNDYIGGVAKEHPTRFFGLAVLPLQDMKAATDELDRCVGKLGMKGILLYSNLAGKFPDEPEFRPLFARAEELDIPVLLHPAYPTTYAATSGYHMAAGLGLMFDTSIALTRIILAGILDRHPKLKLVCPHVGGTLPYVIGRIDHQTMVLKRGAENLKKPPSEYLKQVYLDVVSPLALTIKYGYDFAGPDRLLYSSDHPWVDPALIVNNVKSLGLPRGDEEKIFSLNARRLFKL